MTRQTLKRYKVARRVAIFLAALPLFQFSQCQTGINQVLATTANNAPATAFQVLNSFAYLPLQLLISAIFGTSSTGTGI